MQMINRSKDMMFGNEDLEPLYTIKHFPIYMGVTDEDLQDDIYVDQEWCISKGSGMVQLSKLVPTEVLYKKSHNSSIGRVWQEHHELFAKFIHKHADKNGVLEIGGGNGILNRTYNKFYQTIPWTIIEPSSVEPLPECNAKYMRRFWKEPFDFNEVPVKYDTLIHSHTVEHQFDVNSFMKLCRTALHRGGGMIFSVPNMEEIVKKRYPYALNLEHTYLITEDYIDRLLQQYNFEIIEKQYFIDHSIFYSTRRNDDLPKDIKVSEDAGITKELYSKNKKMFFKYVDYYESVTARLNDVMASHTGSVYVFGAHINTQMLLRFGLNVECIKAVLDNDKLKQGHRLYGTELKVLSPCVLKDEEDPLVILIMGAYNAEIKQDIIDNINANTVIVE